MHHTYAKKCQALTTEHAFGGDGAGTLKGPNASSAELIGDGGIESSQDAGTVAGCCTSESSSEKFLCRCKVEVAHNSFREGIGTAGSNNNVSCDNREQHRVLITIPSFARA